MLYFNHPKPIKSAHTLSPIGKVFSDISQQDLDNVLTPDKVEEKSKMVATDNSNDRHFGKVKNDCLEGLDISTVNEHMQNLIRQMMVDTNLTERQLYISALELMRKEIVSQQRMLKGLQTLLNEIRQKHKDEEIEERYTKNKWGGGAKVEDTFSEIE